MDIRLSDKMSSIVTTDSTDITDYSDNNIRAYPCYPWSKYAI
jgi:hypothetical protein